MYKSQFNARKVFKFKRFSRKNYALFACLGRTVVIGTLSVATLSHAKAKGMSTKTTATSIVDNKEIRLDEVVVSASRAPLTMLQSAKVVAVITKEDIYRASVTSINDVLKLATGVDVRQRGGFGVQTDISINGGTFDQITILLNGINISNPQTGHNASDFPVSLSDIERIEILEGAASRVFGSSALNGAINIITRSSLYNDTNKNNLINIETDGGAYGSLSVGGSYNYLKDSKVNLLTSGGYIRTDGGTNNSDFEKGRFYSQLNWRISPFAQLNAQLGHSRQSYGANTFYSARFSNQYENTKHTIGSVIVTFGNFVKGLTLNIGYNYNNFLDHYQLTRGRTGAFAGENYHNLSVYGYTANLNYDWLIGKTSFGIDYTHERILSTAYGDDLNNTEYKQISNFDRYYTKRGKRNNANIFLEHNVVLNYWTFSLGILANKNMGLDNKCRFSPGVDIAYRPTREWKIFTSWNKAIRIPTYTDLYAYNSVVQGDKDIKPERNSMFKFGANYRTQGLNTSISGFYSRGRDMIDWVYETENSTRYHALNIGKLNNRGVSVDVSILFDEIIVKSFIQKIHFGYAYINQKHQTTAPIFRSLYALEYLKHKAVLTIEHHVISNIKASWSVRWQQRMNGYTPYFKWDGKLIWDKPSYNLYVKADNITAHHYMDIAGVPQPALWLMAGGALKLRF